MVQTEISATPVDTMIKAWEGMTLIFRVCHDYSHVHI
jgi:hypothetical protein